MNNNLDEKNILTKLEIKVNKNLTFLNNFQKIIQGNDYNKILEYFSKYYIKKYDYVLVDVGNDVNSRIRQRLIKISNKIIIVITPNLLGVKEFCKLCKKVNLEFKGTTRSLHIILNKYYFDSISKNIFKKLTKKKIKFSIIFYKKKFEKLKKFFLKNEKIKINILLKKELRNILK